MTSSKTGISVGESAQLSSDSAATSPPPSDRQLPNTFAGGSQPCLPPTTFYNRFQNFYRMLTGTMSPHGQVAFWTERHKRNEARDCKRCESHRDYLLEYSPIIRFMSQNIQKLGGQLDKTNIRCRRCEYHELMEGGFDPRYGIKLCANVVEERSRLEDVMAHEMVHAWDHLRWKVDWASKDADLRSVACTEIRASSLSGECRFANEFFRNRIFKFANQHQQCVRRRAVQSVRSRPNCPDHLSAVRAVNQVWDSCFADTRPFDEIFR